MSNEITCKIVLQGSVFKSARKKRKPKKTARKKSQKLSYEVPAISAPNGRGSISRGVRRSKVGFAQLIGTIKNQPTYHLSLIMPGRVNPEHEAIILKKRLNDFFKKVSRIYPRAYFVRLYGWSQEAGLHAHVLIRFGKKSSRKQKEHDLRKIWNEVSMSDEPKLLHLTKYYENATLGYLTSPNKNHELRTAMHLAGGGRIWSVIGKKNIRWRDKSVLELTNVEHEKFKQILLNLFDKFNLPESGRRQLEKKDYCLNYLPEKLLRLALKRFLKWRADHE